MQASKTFRIFVSSTFSDLKEERNALQKNVFPRLRELCMQNSCRFQAIDLRWGVREEAALDQQTMKICLEEIHRCQRVTPRPNFIVLLGDRYGWRPLPYEIPAKEFEEILKKVSAEDKELLAQWYRRDDNAVSPVYDLQRRTREYVDYSKWEIVERKIQNILEQAISRMRLTDDQRLKYKASATEQEIFYGALKVHDAKEHVFCFFRTVKDIPQDGGSKDFIDLDEKGNLNIDARKQLYDLKNSLRSLLPENIFEYEAEWTGDNITTNHLDKLCKDVHDLLSRVILNEISKIKEIDPLQKEIEDHEAFGKERAKFFVGRVDILNRIDDYIRTGSNFPLAIYGESGSGKTALMAQAVAKAQRNYQDAEIIFRYIGATPNSPDGRSLLESLCKQIYKMCNFEEQKRKRLAKIKGYSEEAQKERQDIEKQYEIPSKFQKLSTTFRDFLTKIPEDKKLILFLDALDQLSDTDHTSNLVWLPAQMSENVRIVVSSLPGECLSALERKLPKGNLIELEPMPLNECTNLLSRWLAEAGRKLQEHQSKEVLERFAKCGLPLYLKLAFEESKRWKSYTEKTDLSLNVSGVIRDLFNRLSLDANHGKIMVSRSLGYLAAAKNGLTEDEMLDVLSRDRDVFNDFNNRAKHKPPEERLPVIVWSRLYFDLEPYLTERSADGTLLMTFYHRQMGEVVSEEYLAGNIKRNIHCALARYYKTKGFCNYRTLSELPFQETEAEIWEELENTLSNLVFLTSSVNLQDIYSLLENFEYAFRKKPYVDFDQSIKAIYETLLNCEAQIHQTPDSLLNQLKQMIPAHLEKLLKLTQNNLQFYEGMRKSYLLLTPKRPLAHHICHMKPPNDVAYTSSGSHLASAGDDGLVIVWSYNSDIPPRTLIHHENIINVIRFSPNGNLLAAGGDNGTIIVWEVATGRIISELIDHRSCVLTLAWSPDGRYLASAGGLRGQGDHEIRVWHVSDWTLWEKYEGSGKPVKALAFSRNGNILASGGRLSEYCHLYDLKRKETLSILQLNDEAIGICFHTSGDYYYVVTNNLKIKIFSSKDDECIGNINTSLKKDFIIQARIWFAEQKDRLFLAHANYLHVYDKSCNLLKEYSDLSDGMIMDLDTNLEQVIIFRKNMLEVRSIPSGELLHTIRCCNPEVQPDSEKISVALAGDGNRVLLVTTDPESILFYDFIHSDRPQQLPIKLKDTLSRYDRSNQQENNNIDVVDSVQRLVIRAGYGHTFKPHVSTGKYGAYWVVNDTLINIETGKIRKIEHERFSGAMQLSGIYLNEDETIIIKESPKYLYEISTTEKIDFRPLVAAVVLRLVIRYGKDSVSLMLRNRQIEPNKVKRRYIPNFPIVKFDRKDELLLFGADTGEVYIAPLNQPIFPIELPSLEDRISSAAWGESGNLIAVGTSSGNIAIATIPEALSQESTVSWSHILNLHSSMILHMDFITFNGQEFLVSSDKNRYMVLTDPYNGKCKTRILLPSIINALRRIGGSLKVIIGNEPKPVIIEITSLEI